VEVQCRVARDQVISGQQRAAHIDVGPLPVVVAVEHGQLFAARADNVILSKLEAVKRRGVAGIQVASELRERPFSHPRPIRVVEIAGQYVAQTGRATYRAYAALGVVEVLVARTRIDLNIARRVILKRRGRGLSPARRDDACDLVIGVIDHGGRGQGRACADLLALRGPVAEAVIGPAEIWVRISRGCVRTGCGLP